MFVLIFIAINSNISKNISIIKSVSAGSGEQICNYTATKKCTITGFLNSSGPASGATQASINGNYFYNQSWGSAGGGGLSTPFTKELNPGDKFYARVYSSTAGYSGNVTIYAVVIE